MSLDRRETPADPKQVASELLGKIHWVSDQKGYCTCPGRRHHSTTTGQRDCVLYIDGAATVFCMHQSCREECLQTSTLIRQALAGNQLDAKPLSATERKERDRERLYRLRLEQRAHSALPSILHKYQWTYEKILEDSPSALGVPRDHWWDLVQLFREGDVIWIGNTYDSGNPDHMRYFQEKSSWVADSPPVGPFICPAVFKNSSFSRSNENVLARRFLVVESDLLTRDEVGAIFRWMKDEVGMSLRAVVDTAGKSLHGWFDLPTAKVLAELQVMLPQMACDPGLFKPSQPVRLPGVLRGDKVQRLIYLDRGGEQ